MALHTLYSTFLKIFPPSPSPSKYTTLLYLYISWLNWLVLLCSEGQSGWWLVVKHQLLVTRVLQRAMAKDTDLSMDVMQQN